MKSMNSTQSKKSGAGRFVGWAAVGLFAIGLGGPLQGQCVPGDVNGDGVVDGADLGILLSAWGSKGHPADLNGDGIVDGADLGALLANWAATCPNLPWATILEQSPDPKVVTDEELRAAIIATGLPWRVRDDASQIEMLLVPPGTFMMGCSPSVSHPCMPDGREEPVHQVTLTQPFYLGRYEVTQAQWTAVMGSNPSNFQSPSAQVPADQVPNRPVDSVSWNQIADFNAVTGLRLPTEAEWEYAYRAGTTRAFHSMPGFPNGTNDDTQVGNIAWFGSNSASQTRPVGGKAANALGLHDMSGNVWEWVNDWFGGYPASPQVDPPGPISGTNRVLRGGSWNVGVSNTLRSSYRVGIAPGSAITNRGFRAARTP